MTRQSQLALLKKKLSEQPDSNKAEVWKGQIERLHKHLESRQIDNKQKSSRRNTKNKNMNKNYLAKRVLMKAPPSTPVDSVRQFRDLSSEYDNATMRKITEDINEYKPANQKRLSLIKNLILPEFEQSKVCDAQDRPTAVVTLKRSIDLYVTFDNSSTAGQFSLAFNATGGSATSLSQYNILYVNSDNGWPQDFSSPASYHTFVDDVDLRVDPTFQQMTQMMPGQTYTKNVFANYNGIAQAIDGDPWKYGNTHWEDTIGVTNTYIGSVTLPSLLGNPIPFLNATKYKLPSGVYNISWYFLNVAGSVTPTPMIQAYTIYSVEPNGTVNGEFQCVGGSCIGKGYFDPQYNRVQILEEHVSPWQGSGQDTNSYLNANYIIEGDVSLIFTMTVTNNTVFTNLESGFIINSTKSLDIPHVSDNGMILKYRIAGTSVLVTNLLSDFQSGGRIVAYSAAPGTISNSYINSQQSGPLQIAANLYAQNQGLMTYDGEFKKGTYAFTQPGLNDFVMRTPSEHSTQDHPSIIVSGFVNTAQSLTGKQHVARINFVQTMEYTTMKLFQTVKTYVGTQEDVSASLAYVGALPHAMENNKHLAKLSKAVNTGANFIMKTAPEITNTVSKMLPLLGMI